MHPPALSTMWMQFNHERLHGFVAAARRMGFHHVELSHVVTPPQIESLYDADAEAIRVLHHPCPNPGGVPPLSTLDREEQEIAISHAQLTIDWAARLGAEAVVLHLGEVELDRRWEHALRARWLQGERATESMTFRAHLERLLAGRHALAARHVEAVSSALARLLPYAERRNVLLAMENGEWFSAIPTLREARALLESHPTLKLWLDTGHATIIERLGGSSLLDWLALAPGRLSGTHYHDVAGLRDHLVPGRGTIAWASLTSLVPPRARPTCEFDWYYDTDELIEGAALLAHHRLIDYQQP